MIQNSSMERMLLQELRLPKYAVIAMLCFALAGSKMILAILICVHNAINNNDFLIHAVAVDWFIFAIPFLITGWGIMFFHVNARKNILDDKFVKMLRFPLIVRKWRVYIHMTAAVLFLAMIGFTARDKFLRIRKNNLASNMDSDTLLGYAVGSECITIMLILVAIAVSVILIKYVSGYLGMVDNMPGWRNPHNREKNIFPWVILNIIVKKIKLIFFVLCIFVGPSITGLLNVIIDVGSMPDDVVLHGIGYIISDVLYVRRGTVGLIISVVSCGIAICLLVMSINVRDSFKKINDNLEN